jgi:hypothetical protein
MAEYTTDLCKKQQTGPGMVPGCLGTLSCLLYGIGTCTALEGSSSQGHPPDPATKAFSVGLTGSPFVEPRSNSTLKKWGGIFIQQCPQSVNAQGCANGEGE